MVKLPDILSLKVKITKDGKTHFGIAIAERYSNKSILILERYYRTLSDVNAEVASQMNQETIVEILEDWGEMFEKQKPKI